MPGTQPAVIMRWFGLMLVWAWLLSACWPDSLSSTPVPTIPPAPTASQTAEIISLPLSHTPLPPESRMIELNTSIEGVYVPDQAQELYSFNLEQSGRIGIVLVVADDGAPLNLVTRLYNEAGDLLPQITAPVGQPMMRNEWDLNPGSYHIEIFGVETSARAFTLTVIERPVAELGGGRIAYGETRSGEIRVRGQRDVWTFQGQMGDQILVTMIAPMADAYLEFYAPDGHLLAQNDDSTQFGSSPVLDVLLPVNGDYSVVARMVDDDQTGAYQLVLEQQERTED